MDREIRILHTADTHLGYRQYHSEVRRQDFFKAFETVIQDAVDMQVDAVVHAGDLFDSRNPTLEDLLETMNILSRLKIANIPFFGIVGNHESKQTTQWLDLFEEMGLAVRLGKKPQLVGDVAIYGIDSVPKSKIPLYDYSGFEIPESLPENCRKLLVMHQIMPPSPYPDWDCAEVLEKMPFNVDAILLGDYHEYEKIKVGETWVTYSGSTERNSASEKGPRSYSIITLSAEGLEISRRTIPTRDFIFITAKLDGEEKPYEQIFSTVSERLEDIPDSVVFLEVLGDSGSVLSFSEIEEYLLSKGALVSNVKDARVKEGFPEKVVEVAFSDPDSAVAKEIRRMSLNDGGLIIDEVIRNPDVPRSRVDEETENRLMGLIETIDFKDPDFMIKIPVSPVSSADPAITGKAEELEPADVEEKPETLEPAAGAEFAVAAAGKSETLRAPVRIQRSESLNESLGKSFETPDEAVESPDAISEPSDSIPESPAESPFLSEISQKIPGNPEEIQSGENGERAVSGKDSEEESKIGSGKLLGLEVKAGPEKEAGVKTEKISKEISADEKPAEEKPVEETPADEKPAEEKLSEEKPAQAPEKAAKPVKQSHKKGKEKSAVPRQYNLGDYL
jgi:DNA repair exonuclease SbcCD nuclease subunit